MCIALRKSMQGKRCLLDIQLKQSKIYLLAHTKQLLQFLQCCLSRKYSGRVQKSCGFVFALVYAQELCHRKFWCHYSLRFGAPLMPPSSEWLREFSVWSSDRFWSHLKEIVDFNVLAPKLLGLNTRAAVAQPWSNSTFIMLSASSKSKKSFLTNTSNFSSVTKESYYITWWYHPVVQCGCVKAVFREFPWLSLIISVSDIFCKTRILSAWRCCEVIMMHPTNMCPTRSKVYIDNLQPVSWTSKIFRDKSKLVVRIIFNGRVRKTYCYHRWWGESNLDF